MTDRQSQRSRLCFPLTIGEALDLNDNGRLGWPDLLGWTVLTTLGALSIAVLTFVSLMLLVGFARGAHSTTRSLALVARNVAHRGKHVAD